MGLRERAIDLATAALDLAEEVSRREVSDTIPAPPTERTPTPSDTFPSDDPSSERIAREFGWIDSPGEPPEWGIDSAFVAPGVARR